MNDRLLVLVRHGESDWNKKNLFTGWRDIDLSEQGVKEAREAGRKLKAQGLKFDVAFTSALIRAQRTLDLMLEELGQTGIPVFKDQALNERDYGDLSGLNKDDARKKWGEEQVHIWRRSYDDRAAGRREFARHRCARAAYYIRKSCRACCAASACWCRRTAIRCARWSWCSTARRPRASPS